MNPARLHVFTGKGGVGKTVFSLAYALALKEQGHKVLYNAFDQIPHKDFCRELGLEELSQTVEESALTYMEKKLGSHLIASWIAKTPFFRALYDMLPSFGQMILFGHLVERLQQDPELTIVMDSPSSGHALTLFEASTNFREMFKTGLIVNDINKMLDFILKPEHLSVKILALPTLMALQEGQELKQKLAAMEISNSELWLNDCLALNPALEHPAEGLPPFLEKKMAQENQVLAQYKDDYQKAYPRFTTFGQIETVRTLAERFRQE